MRNHEIFADHVHLNFNGMPAFVPLLLEGLEGSGALDGPNMRTDMVLDALEMAAWARGTQLGGLVCESDAGSQFTWIRFGDRLAEVGALPSIGSVCDSYDNALAETVIGLHKTELIRPRGPWRNVEDVELATLGWVDWFNNQRLHGHLGDLPPAEFEAAYAAQQADPELVGTP